MITFIIPIQSISDIITNSSSELFVAFANPEQEFTSTIVAKKLQEIWDNDDKKREELWNQYCSGGKNNWDKYDEALYKLGLDESSGDAAECEVTTLSYKDIAHDVKRHFRGNVDKKNGLFLQIRIDHNRRHSIDWIRNNLSVVSSYSC